MEMEVETARKTADESFKELCKKIIECYDNNQYTHNTASDRIEFSLSNYTCTMTNLESFRIYLNKNYTHKDFSFFLLGIKKGINNATSEEIPLGSPKLLIPNKKIDTFISEVRKKSGIPVSAVHTNHFQPLPPAKTQQKPTSPNLHQQQTISITEALSEKAKQRAINMKKFKNGCGVFTPGLPTASYNDGTYPDSDQEERNAPKRRKLNNSNDSDGNSEYVPSQGDRKQPNKQKVRLRSTTSGYTRT